MSRCALDAAMPLEERILEDPHLFSRRGCYCCHWTGTEPFEKLPGDKLMGLFRRETNPSGAITNDGSVKQEALAVWFNTWGCSACVEEGEDCGCGSLNDLLDAAQRVDAEPCAVCGGSGRWKPRRPKGKPPGAPQDYPCPHCHPGGPNAD